MKPHLVVKCALPLVKFSTLLMCFPNGVAFETSWKTGGFTLDAFHELRKTTQNYTNKYTHTNVDTDIQSVCPSVCLLTPCRDRLRQTALCRGFPCGTPLRSAAPDHSLQGFPLWHPVEIGSAIPPTVCLTAFLSVSLPV